jgi:hypothetical protein
MAQPTVQSRLARRFIVLIMNAALVAASCTAAAGAGDWESSGSEELRAMPGARADDPEIRVGQVYWVQPKARPYSVDFFETLELTSRVPVNRSRRFKVVAVQSSRDDEPVYQVQFESGVEAFIPVASFESELYVDPPPMSATPLKSNIYLSPEAYFYSIKSIFSEDPDVLHERIRNLGPSRIRQFPHSDPLPKPEPRPPRPMPQPGRD